jgi:ParB-like chromosome segregation protein Spo0J
MKANKIARIYRNPIYLAREYKEMIDSGKVKNQAELAKLKGISRARVTQILNLLKFDKNIIDHLEKIGDPMERKVISERKLRNMINKNYSTEKNCNM